LIENKMSDKYWSKRQEVAMEIESVIFCLNII